MTIRLLLISYQAPPSHRCRKEVPPRATWISRLTISPFFLVNPGGALRPASRRSISGGDEDGIRMRLF